MKLVPTPGPTNNNVEPYNSYASTLDLDAIIVTPPIKTEPVMPKVTKNIKQNNSL